MQEPLDPTSFRFMTGDLTVTTVTCVQEPLDPTSWRFMMRELLKISRLQFGRRDSGGGNGVSPVGTV